jgi:Ca2+-binding RTX toxin-like protein
MSEVSRRENLRDFVVSRYDAVSAGHITQAQLLAESVDLAVRQVRQEYGITPEDSQHPFASRYSVTTTVVDDLLSVFVGDHVWGRWRGNGDYWNGLDIDVRRGASGYREEFIDRSDQLQHTVAALWAGYHKSWILEAIANLNETEDPDQAVNYVAIRLGNTITDQNIDQLALLLLKGLGTSEAVEAYLESRADLWAPKCFPASTPVRTSRTASTPISRLRPGDTVLAFDPRANRGRGALVARRVTRLYRNTTTEWVRLRWVEEGAAREVVSTPGHHFLDEFGSFPTIAEMLRDGRATVVLASGELAEVTAERIVYSAETAHLFERAVAYAGTGDGTAAQPVELDCWQTYNIEVEDLHTYVAGGVRVHNDSGWLGVVGNIFSAGDDRHNHDGLWDTLGDGLSNLLHGIGTFFNDTLGFQHKGPIDLSSGRVVNSFGSQLNFGGELVSTKINEVVVPGYGSPIQVYGGDGNGGGPFVGQQVQPGGDYDGDGNLTSMDRALHNADLYDRMAADAENDGSGYMADYYRDKADDYREQAGQVGNTSGDSDDSADGSGSNTNGSGGGLIGWFTSLFNPILLDLDGNGVSITALSESSVFVDAGGEGLEHRTAWAGVGDGVLFFDVGGVNDAGDGQLTQKREFVFTEWDPSAKGDLEALASYFDTNGDGVLNSSDAKWSQFKVMVTNADGSRTVQTLTQLGITSINLRGDTVNLELPDGSVITDQTLFTRGNGTTGIVANTTLAAEAEGHVVEVNGTTKTVKDADGDILYRVDTVVSHNNTKTTNRWDDDGDGTWDRVQVIDRTVGFDSLTGATTVTRMVRNWDGAETATGALTDRRETVTVTVGNSTTTTIRSDAAGGGWFDREEVRVFQANGNGTVTLRELSKNGTVLSERVETITAQGLHRVEALDLDNNGQVDQRVDHDISVNANGARTETTQLMARNWDLLGETVEWTSGSGRVRWIKEDLDCVGGYDVRTDHTVTRAGDDVTAVVTVSNRDDTVRSSVTHVTETVTNPAGNVTTITKTVQENLDGDLNGNGTQNVERTTVETTVINATTGGRERTVFVTNEDGSKGYGEKVTLAADKITTQTWIDLNQNGAFEANELVEDVKLSGTDRVAMTWARNVDGSFGSLTQVTSTENGLKTTTLIDADGDSAGTLDIETRIVDETVITGTGSTRTVTTSAEGGTSALTDDVMLSVTKQVASADGLTVTTWVNSDGDTVAGGGQEWDSKTIRQTSDVAGVVTTTVSTYAGNESTLLSKTVTVQSADRRVTTTTVDENGDAQDDLVVVRTVTVSGSVETVSERFNPDGTTASREETTASADGLVLTQSTDGDGDDRFETLMQSTTVLNANGSRTRTDDVLNEGGTLRSRTVTETSGNGLSVTVKTDADGDGAFERETTSATSFAVNGTTSVTEEVRSDNNTLISSVVRTTSDDGLVVTENLNRDGAGGADLIRTTTTTLEDDGKTLVVTELRNAAGQVRDRTDALTTDDGRTTTTSVYSNGATQADTVTVRAVANDGTTLTTVSEYNGNDTLQSRTSRSVSDDGLVVIDQIDSDGLGGYERVSTTTTVLGQDGGTTRTTKLTGSDGFTRSLIEEKVSDDGLTVTISENIDGGLDGFDLVTERTTVISQAGVRTETETRDAANGEIFRSTKTTSADGRSIDQSIDLDGNGRDDLVIAITEADDGTVETLTEFLSNGTNSLAAQTIATRLERVSGSGQDRYIEVDSNGDGRADRFIYGSTSRDEHGTQTQVVQHFDGHRRLLASEMTIVSDDGLATTIHRDHDGDGIDDFVTDDSTSFEINGDTVRVQVTRSGSFDELARITTRVSGNGLDSSILTDFSGDGSADRFVERTETGDGAVSVTTREYTAGFDLARSTTVSTSWDGLVMDTVVDSNGDLITDRTVHSEQDDDRTWTTTWRDLETDGATRALVETTTANNGALSTFRLDADADGFDDLTRSTTVSFEADGDRVETFVETDGIGRAIYSETTTTALNGLSSTTIIDADGDGDTDATSTVTTALMSDGSRVVTAQTTYSDGDLRARSVVETSADGRLVTEAHDYDGNGIDDKRLVTQTLSDGTRIETESAYSEAGVLNATFVTTTSADGLTTTILRNGNLQTITRSELDPGTYIWDNGVTASTTQVNRTSSHERDAVGIETWTATNTWKVGTSTTSETFTARLDADAMARIVAEASRVFDTILDRGMDFNEREFLVKFVANGQLNQAGLADALLNNGVLDNSAEFAGRYGTLSDAEYVTQLHLNSFGRAPTMAELSSALSQLASGGASARTTLALDLAESSEHLAVGNGHMATNNFDVIMNPVQFERFLDEAYVTEIAESLVDAVYDRDATVREVAYITDRLLHDLDNVDDLVWDLLQVNGSVNGVSTQSLRGLSGAALVESAFENALGRQPTAEEQAAWLSHLSSGRISTSQFIASLALSVEHLGTGNSHLDYAPANGSTINGNSGAETLTGAAGSDKLTGNAGADSLVGGAGNDFYFWSTGHGNDTINDIASWGTENDVLTLTNVASTGVTLERTHNTSTLIVRITGTQDFITINKQYDAGNDSDGIEEIRFSDGVIWNFDDIQAHTVLKPQTTQLSDPNNFTGVAFAERIDAEAGDDTIAAGGGDDTLIGGTGSDTLAGGNGADRYEWQSTHGNDRIEDNGLSLDEADVLVLAGVNSADVQLFHYGDHSLQIKIGTTATITVVNQFLNTAEGRGIERIEFADRDWDRADILWRADFEGADGSADSLVGTGFDDRLVGRQGNDTLNGGLGDDTFRGGLDLDSLIGGAGADTYFWSRGDGNDTIFDTDDSKTSTDILDLRDVSSGDVTLSRLGNDLHVVIGGTNGATIVVQGRFESLAEGNGVEAIRFGDGEVWTLETILDRAITGGGTGADTLSAGAYRANLYGFDAADTLTGGNGDDVLVGGVVGDLLKGGKGSDLYVWELGDGNDTITDINDTSTGATDVDVLEIDLASDDVELQKVGNDLVITRISNSTSILVTDRFNASTSDRGIEKIVFNDGVVAVVLDDPSGIVSLTGSSGNDSMTGWALRDYRDGGAGSDTLEGGGHSDTLVGGLGNDVLRGGTDAWSNSNGNDVYIWKPGDGADIIDEHSRSLTEIDTLELDIASSELALRRTEGSDHLRVIYDLGGTNETEISVLFQFNNLTYGYGLESVVFNDGVVWTKDDIQANTRTVGDSLENTLDGDGFRDNLYGLGGADVLNGGGGDDWLYGGAGADSLLGGTGNDTYVQSGPPDGVDTINDGHTSTSLSETDTLILLGTLPGEVTLRRAGIDLEVFVGGTRIVVVQSQYYEIGTARGIEAISFNDGSLWTLDDILDRTEFAGSGTFNGTAFRDNLIGGSGADTISGLGGDDRLIGGSGNDLLRGGNGEWGSNGNDTYVWTPIDGSDTIDDHSESLTESDTLEVAATSASFTLRRSGADDLEIVYDLGGTNETKITVYNQFYSVIYGFGLERIVFNDGVNTPEIWTLADILSHTLTEGNASANTLAGTTFADNLYGYGGADTLNGADGDDLLVGGAGADAINGGNGLDTVSYITAGQGVSVSLNLTTAQTGTSGDHVGDVISGVEHLEGSEYNDSLTGNADSNDIFGLGGNDTIVGLDGYDRMFGGDGNDVLKAGTAADWVDGGDGIDRVTYNGSNSAVFVDLNDINLNDGDAAGDSYHSIENLTGTGYGDTLKADDAANYVDGGDGADDIVGRGGADTLLGEAGSDTLAGGDGTDSLDGGDLADLLFGGASNDSLFGGLGSDTLNGDGGSDSISGGDAADTLYGGDGVDSLYGGIGGDRLEGGNDTGQLYGDAGSDWIAGGDAADTLYGGDDADSLYGGSSSDRLEGGAGADVLFGESGNDTLVGGSGADQFRFTTTLGSGNVDVISDMAVGTDDIALAMSIFAALGSSVSASELRVGTAATTTAHRLIYNSATGALSYDADGSGAGAAVQFATLGTGLALTNGDFIMV